ncbi:DUF4168 domain-containing protein [Chroococcus sp. FPU101]|uniref:DUF4168 domain-containing protein n=1 Tax=Chroococcus sp. FPU101 TaxID=1974212 RepID=UPI001A8D0047|nr:DUF4168 domain-containing protein [Chroococcus sp. FPU101]
MFIFGSSLFDLSRILTRLLITSVLSTVGILSGFVPEFSWHSTQLNFNSSAYTQDVTDDQVNKYAKAVLQMESYRQQAYREITQIMGKTPPEIVCNQRDSFRSLPTLAQRVAVNYCNTSKKIVESSGLSSSQFNAITLRVRSDDGLKRRIQNEIRRLQRANN